MDVRIKRAEEYALQRLDYIINSYFTSDFVEIVGRVGKSKGITLLERKAGCFSGLHK